MITIVYANPAKEGVNTTILNSLTSHLKQGDKEYQLIDLYEDNLDPVLTKEERSTFFTGTGISTDPQVKKYQDTLKETEHVIFIFPIWWMSYPAILKGFFERTCLPGFSVAYTKTGMEPLLNNIKQFTILTVAGGVPKDALADIIENHFIKGMLSMVTKNAKADWLHTTVQFASTPEGMESHIEDIKKLI